MQETDVGGMMARTGALILHACITVAGMVGIGVTNGLVATAVFGGGRWSAYRAGDMAAASYGCPAQRYGTVAAGCIMVWVVFVLGLAYRLLVTLSGCFDWKCPRPAQPPYLPPARRIQPIATPVVVGH
jgi:hypothetical protein